MQYIKAIVFDGQWWAHQDISQMLFVNAMQDLEAFRVVVEKDDGSKAEVRSDDLRENFSWQNAQGTVSEILDMRAQSSFNLFDITDLHEAKGVESTDLWDFDVKVDRGNSSYGEGTNIPLSYQHDLVITSNAQPATKGSIGHLSGDSVFFAVNGLIYPKLRIGDRLFLLGAGLAMKDSVHTGVTVIDFGPVGGVQVQRIEEGDLSSAKRQDIHGEAVESLVAIRSRLGDIKGKDYFLIEAGHMRIWNEGTDLLNDDVVRHRVNHRKGLFRVLRRPVKLRYRYIANYQPSQPQHEPSFSARHYLGAGDSFLVVYNETDVIKNREPFYSSGLPGEYVFHREPTGIPMDENGNVAHMKKLIDEETKKVYSTNPIKKEWALNETTGQSNSRYTTPALANVPIDDNGELDLITIYRLDD